MNTHWTEGALLSFLLFKSSFGGQSEHDRQDNNVHLSSSFGPLCARPVKIKLTDVSLLPSTATVMLLLLIMM